MKAKKLFVTLGIGAMACCALIGCGKKKESGGTNVIQIRMYKGGFGRDWFDQICDKFVKYEASLGNSVAVNVYDYTKAVGETAKNEILTVTDNVTDLYLLDGPDIHDIISQSYSKLRTDKQALLEPLNDILAQPSVGFDGKVETMKIRDKLIKGYEDSCTYHNVSTVDKWEGKVFVLPWIDALTGIVTNKRVLDRLGIDLPLTSNQFTDVVKKIYRSNSGVKPFVYSGQDAPGYWNYLYNTWLGQYVGYEGYKQFMSCLPDESFIPDGEDPEEYIQNKGYLVYQDPSSKDGKDGTYVPNKGVEKSVEAMLEILDVDYCVQNSGAATYNAAQHCQAVDEAVFMCNGDWSLKEMTDSASQYYNLMKDFVMLKAPILSCMGPEVGLDTDDELATLVRMIDENRTNEEIKTALSNKINDEGIERIVKARGVRCGEGPNHVMLIPSYADAKDYAKELVRFMYSNDAANLFNEVCYACLPILYTPDEGRVLNPYQESLNSFYTMKDMSIVCERSEFNEVRPLGGIYLFNNTNWVGPASTFPTIMDHKRHASDWTASYIATEEAKFVKTQWAAWMAKLDW
ncbi:MAG: extracellular solute-binding protein [Bacilli bacterium]|nr:extracellular solute-binding protein [Bacilli bacterium]